MPGKKVQSPCNSETCLQFLVKLTSWKLCEVSLDWKPLIVQDQPAPEQGKKNSEVF